MKKILVIGSGGREHAVGWALKKGSDVELFFAPGNGGTAQIGKNIDIAVDQIEQLLSWAKENRIDLTFVGPELPLTLGIVDSFEKEGLTIFGPNKQAAQLEGSKAFSKAFLENHKIPTAKYNTYTELNEALKGLDNFTYPLVIKADGLASGKGVLICETFQEAQRALTDILEDNKFGEAGNRVVIEEFLVGKEASILCFCDGETMVPMVSAQDYKRALDDDKGLNTGGMGAVSPAFYYSENYQSQFENEILPTTLEALKEEGIHYKGVLYFGLMLTKGGIKILEFNARFGDPETEAVLMRLETSLLQIMEGVCLGKLSEIDIRWNTNPAICVVTAAGGYPENYDTGERIRLPKIDSADIQIFHAGTKETDGKLLSNGGRVLVTSGVGENLNEVRELVYNTLQKIEFAGSFYRTDIGRQ